MTGFLELNPIKLLKIATTAVPAVRYAVGIVGIATALFIIRGLLPDVSLISMLPLVGGSIIAMAMLVVFSAAAAGPKKKKSAVGIVFLWASCIFIIVFMAFTITAVAIGEPKNWAEIILPKKAADVPLIPGGRGALDVARDTNTVTIPPAPIDPVASNDSIAIRDNADPPIDITSGATNRESDVHPIAAGQSQTVTDQSSTINRQECGNWAFHWIERIVDTENDIKSIMSIYRENVELTAVMSRKCTGKTKATIDYFPGNTSFDTHTFDGLRQALEGMLLSRVRGVEDRLGSVEELRTPMTCLRSRTQFELRSRSVPEKQFATCSLYPTRITST